MISMLKNVHGLDLMNQRFQKLRQKAKVILEGKRIGMNIQICLEWSV